MVNRILALWFVIAIAIGATGILIGIQFPFPQIIIAALSIFSLFIAFLVPGIRREVEAFSIRSLISFHIIRFVGVYFLKLYAEGRLPFEFGVHGGIGDIITASWAALLLARPGRKAEASNRPILYWNVFGFIDILYVVFTAGRFWMRDPSVMAELQHLPLSLLPLFFVPLIIVTHLLIFSRLLWGPEAIKK